MRPKKYLLSFLVIYCSLTNACSQTEPTDTLPGTSVFQGSTPGDELIKSLLTIPANSKVDFIRWNLIFNSINSEQHTFSLDIVFGESQQNTLGFKGGGQKLSFTGDYSVSVNNDPSFNGEIYHLKSDKLPTRILLRKVNNNLLHLLTAQNALMIGDAGWSYTLNRINPITNASSTGPSQTTGLLPTSASSDTLIVFIGRTLCSAELLELNGITASGCQRIKWVLTLHWDAKTRMPATFQLKAIYVATGDSVYIKVGKWELTRGIKSDANAIVYLLRPDAAKNGGSLAFLRGDDNVLFFLDKNRNLMVGNADHSYTLNRKPK